MRTYALAIAAAALFALPTSAFPQGVEFGPGGIRIEPGYHNYYHGRSAYGGECRELRLACIRVSPKVRAGIGLGGTPIFSS